MTDELNEMIKGFVEESHEAFDDIEHDLLAIETNPDDINIVNSVFRVMHTIKGTAGFLNLGDISNLSHKIESIFDMVRRSEIAITGELMDTILPAIDLLKLMVFELQEEHQSEYDLNKTIQILEYVAENSGNLPGEEDSNPQPFRNHPVENARQIDNIPPNTGLKDTTETTIDEDDLSGISPELREDFVVEAEEHLEVIEQNLLKLEKDPENENSVNEVFRAIHSIKGTSDYVNLKKITRLAHGLETIFDKIRKGQSKYDNELADVVLKGVDILRTLVFMLKVNDNATQIQIDDILEQLKGFVPDSALKNSELILRSEMNEKGSGSANHLSPNIPQVPDAAEKQEEPDDEKDYNSIYNAFNNNCSQQIPVIQLISESLTEEDDPQDDLPVLRRSLKTLGESAQKIGIESISTYCAAMWDLIEQYDEKNIDLDILSMSLKELSTILADEVQKMQMGGSEQFKHFIKTSKSAKIPSLKESTQSKAVSGPEKAVKAVPEKSSAPKSSTSEESGIKTMRVDSVRLDTFMNLIGEIIIARNTFSHLLGELSIKNMPPETYKGLKSVENLFSRISEDMQVTLMEMRLIPVKSVFQKIPRIVRDISRKKKKKIQLQMIGEDVEIDKSIIEMIGDPLVHIVRNSCDHGIETTEERMKSGKQETGNIILKASHLGAEIAIDIIDDGAGINTEKVLEKAIERGLVQTEEIHKLDKKAINSFIFHPGFSTADQVTDISGRGVGMDVVSANVKKIHGSVTVDSEPGEGTQIRLLLPLTLAVVDALLIEDHGQKFAIPLEAVKETIEIKERELQKLKQKEAITLRGDIIGISRLSTLLDRETEPAAPDKVMSVVFINVGSRVIGLIVDDLAKQQEIVVKPLQRHLANIPGISGSTILGNGEIILILDPSELIDLAAL